MQTVSASDLKQNSIRLQDALRDDLLVTKRDKPFVVVMDYEKYKMIEQYIHQSDDDNALPALSKEHIKALLARREKRKLKLTTFDKGAKIAEFSREDAYNNAI